jgi:hypothetical protein
MRSTAVLSPCTTFRTPSGRPASEASSARRKEADGSFSDGFSTNVLPHAIASGNIHIGTIAGKLNGVMPATTPSGWRIEATSTRVETCVDSSPLSWTLMPHASSTISMPRATSPSASECTLPCSAVISSAISSRWASSSSRYLNSTAVRLASEDSPQDSKAALAEATAASTSSTVANATCFSWAPVAGL